MYEELLLVALAVFAIPGSIVVPIVLLIAWWKGGIVGLRRSFTEQRLRVLGMVDPRNWGR